MGNKKKKKPFKKYKGLTTRQIGLWFIKPLMRFCPSNVSMKDFMEELFSVKERMIEGYKVREDLSFQGEEAKPGQRYSANARSSFRAYKNQKAWARFDDRTPEIVEMELGEMHRAPFEARTYVLDRAEWNRIRTKFSLLKK